MKERTGYIDVMRGLGMLCIMWGHVMLGGRTNALVYAFHIPAFFFMSGMVFKREKYPTLGALIKRKALTLLLPYLIWSAVTWCWYVADLKLRGLSAQGSLKYLLETFVARGSGGYLVHNVALWFVTCRFVTQVIWWFLSRLKPAYALAAAAVLAAIGVLMLRAPFFDFKRLPWSIEVALQACVFFGLGNIASSVRFKKINPLPLAAACAASFALLYLGAVSNGRVTMAQGMLGKNPLIFYLTALCGTAFLLSLSLLADRLPERAPLRFVKWFGRNSFTVMACHIPIMLLCVRAVAALWRVSADSARYSWKCTLPAMVMMVAASSLVVWIVEKIKKALSAE